MSEAWQFFFCAACQTERPISERRNARRKGINLARCVRCMDRVAFKSKPKESYDAGDYEAPAIPAEILDAYQESLGR